MAGLGEIDVVGLSFTGKTAILCEVSTHLGGLEYGKGYDDSAERVRKKYQRLREYAGQYLDNFETKRFMFWSPRVPAGRLTALLEGNEGLELVINGRYKGCVDELHREARKTTSDMGNPFFWALQILEHLRD